MNAVPTSEAKILSSIKAGLCTCCDNALRDLCPKCGRCKGCGCEDWCLYRER